MSNKRTSPESSTDKPTNGDSDSFQQDDNAKRAKLKSLSDTTLQDLPMELIENILIKAVDMEVMGITRKNSEWKKTAELVISRLTTVCSQWSSILTTDYFRNELHRIFDAEKTIRLEIVQKFQFTRVVYDAIALNDELFVIDDPSYYDDIKRYSINVYDRKNVAVVKDVIPLPGIYVEEIAGCNVSNCLYILNNKPWHLSIMRITKTDEHQYKISPLIYVLKRYDTLSVAANGSLVLGWQERKEQRGLISVYDPNGHLLHETRLTSDVCSFFFKVIPKADGNFVLVSRNDHMQTKLIEINMHGTVLRQYQSSLQVGGAVCQADKREQIAIVRKLSRKELLDSDLKELEYAGPQHDAGRLYDFDKMHFNRERNEVVATADLHDVVILRYIEE